MATIRIHEDQENHREFRPKQGLALAAHGISKRPILGSLENVPALPKHKQPLGYLDANKINNENFYSNKQCKPPAPAVPVAQFKAFKVYEDSEEEATLKRNIEEQSKSIVQIIDEDDENVEPVAEEEETQEDIFLKLPKFPVIKYSEAESPMSVEKTIENNTSVLSPIGTRNKDFFFHLIDYRDDIYKYLCEQQLKQRPKPQYMRRQPDITYDMRTILVDWLVEVSEEYKLNTETLYLAINFIDRFLSYMSVVRSKLQLVGTASMFIAAKYEEIFPPDVGEFVYITDDTYTKRQVIRMESLVLKVLDFDISIPTTYTFITAMCIANHMPDLVTYLAQYLSELALLDAEQTLSILPSKMAASSIALANYTLRRSVWNKSLEESTNYTLSELQEGITFLHEMHKKASTLPQQAIQEKYKKQEYLKVSALAVREEEITFD